MTATHTVGPPQGGLRSIADLPGPPGRPLVGNLFQLKRDVIHQGVERWCEQYGSLFKFRIGRRQLLVVADHALIADVLRDRPHGWRRTQQLQVVSREMGLKPGLFGAEGEAWRAQRRMVMSGLDPSRVRAYFPSLQRVTERLHRRWLQAANEGRALPTAARADALHGGHRRRPCVRARYQHAGKRWRHHPAAPGPHLSGAVSPPDGAAAVLALVQAARRPRARPQRGHGEAGDCRDSSPRRASACAPTRRAASSRRTCWRR